VKPRSFIPAKPTPAPHNRVKPMKLDSRPSRLPKAGSEAIMRSTVRCASTRNLPGNVVADNGKEVHIAGVTHLMVTTFTQRASEAHHNKGGAQ
jgi:hypothetical protein